jgi:hypothetical protein
LTGLSTASLNEFAEVVLGGTIAITASVVFFGVVATQDIVAGGTFDLGSREQALDRSLADLGVARLDGGDLPEPRAHGARGPGP